MVVFCSGHKVCLNPKYTAIAQAVHTDFKQKVCIGYIFSHYYCYYLKLCKVHFPALAKSHSFLSSTLVFKVFQLFVAKMSHSLSKSLKYFFTVAAGERNGLQKDIFFSTVVACLCFVNFYCVFI